ncbi:Stage II sporulation protein [Desulfamplus magnetovallimortis]|uniref:Anti-sigma factor antagonist n=1 Tax=Desulfamplus magnetovallimortis TaxID=1246637 RepID=A0A1W1H8Z9_9BACT|nr:STAS domain-containing protein [Desulfamplus magnetovallimortis]SLM28923.1 Stage II sporulation protein [Desulfamplus magnetovallimortis]
MDVNIKQSGSISIVSVTGRMDAITADSATTVLNEQVQSGNKSIVLDLSGVDYMSSAGLRVVLTILKAARKDGGDLYIADAQKGVADVLEISGFSNLLKIFDTVDEAVAEFNS